MRCTIAFTATLISLALSTATCLPAQGAEGHPEPVQFRVGFLAGNSYLELPSDQRTLYIMGLVDGFYFAPVLGAPRTAQSDLLWVEECVQARMNNQISAMVDKFLTDHPERWNEPMNKLLYETFVEMCPGNPVKEARKRQ